LNLVGTHWRHFERISETLNCLSNCQTWIDLDGQEYWPGGGINAAGERCVN